MFVILAAAGAVAGLRDEILAANSATAVLEAHCPAEYGATPPFIRAEQVKGEAPPPPPAIAAALSIKTGETVRHRHVRLKCGETLYSEAHNWYVPERLTAEMNAALEGSDTPFGKVVAPLKPSRTTLAIDEKRRGKAIFTLSAVLKTADGSTIAGVTEAYRKAATTVPLMPPEISSQIGGWRNGVAPTPLWTASARKGYRQRLRLVTYGIVRTRIALIIDERDDGRITGNLVTQRLNSGGKFESEKHHSFRATRADLDMLESLATEARLWRIYPQFWLGDEGEDSICLDGMEVELERATQEAYRFSAANAQCTAPLEYLAYARALFRVAGQTVPGWLGTD